MESIDNLNWFPGHMTKAKRAIAEDIKLVDIVVEILDARVPLSSSNPDVGDMTKGKTRVTVLNKGDLADPESTSRWVDYFKSKNISVAVIDCVSGKGISRVPELVKSALRDKIEANAQKGIKKSIRMMIVGVPNVGKSSFINKTSGRASTKTGDKPGVTRGKQWIRLANGYELLDTPGILWPKFDDKKTGINLACTGAVKDEIIDSEYLACSLIGILREKYPDSLKERYKLSELSGMDYDILEQIGKNRGFLRAGGVIDTERASKILIDEFRGGKLGRLTLEEPKNA